MSDIVNYYTNINSIMEGKKTLSDLIFEIKCLGCGQTVYNLPYVKDTHHTMTCQHCGEVSIVHIDKKGGIHSATSQQRDVAYEYLKFKVLNYLLAINVENNYFKIRGLDWEEYYNSFYNNNTCIALYHGYFAYYSNCNATSCRLLPIFCGSVCIFCISIFLPTLKI